MNNYKSKEDFYDFILSFIKKSVNIEKYKNIYIVRTHLGESYILALMLNCLNKENDSIIVTLKKENSEIFQLLCPTIPCIYLPIKSSIVYEYLSETFTQYNNFNFILYLKQNFYENIWNTPNNKPVHFYQEIIKHFNVIPKKFLVKNLLSNITSNSLLKKIERINLNLNKFVIISPEAYSCRAYDNSFWLELIKEFKYNGFDVFVNLQDSNNILSKHCKTCKLTILEFMKLTTYSKGIVALRSGLLDLISTLGIPLHILYTEFPGPFGSLNKDTNYCIKVFSLKRMPSVNKFKIYEYNTNAISSDDLIKKIVHHFQSFIHVKKNKFYEKHYICGIQYKLKKLNIEQNQKIQVSLTDRSLYEMNSAMTVSKQHSKIFPQFKNKHPHKIGILTATGPTMLYYNPIKNGIHFGVNTAFQKINLDYWFAIDVVPIQDYIDEIQKTQFIKFFGQGHLPYPVSSYYERKRHIPDTIIENSKNAYKFYFNLKNYETINIDIENQPLPDLGSCVFSAAYFALYTGIKKLYIVGCDCALNGYFNGRVQEKHFNVNNLIKFWHIFKGYAEIFYPDTEIISINPVGLKGMFKDVYTRNYLDANPELKEELGNNIEILEEECV